MRILLIPQLLSVSVALKVNVFHDFLSADWFFHRYLLGLTDEGNTNNSSSPDKI